MEGRGWSRIDYRGETGGIQTWVRRGWREDEDNEVPQLGGREVVADFPAWVSL